MKANDMHRHGFAYTFDVERGLYTVTLPWGEAFSDPWEGVVLRWIDDQVEELERRRAARAASH